MQYKYISSTLLLFLVALQQLDIGAGARILAPFFFPGKSHFMMTDAIIKELVKRGDEVTFITPFSLAEENLGVNYTEILIPQYNFWDKIKEITGKETILEMTDVSTISFIRMLNYMGKLTTNFAFEQPEVQRLINAKNKVGKYDLLLAEQFYNEGALILAHLYQIPIITVSTFGYANYFSSMVGIMTPWSYVPHQGLPYTDNLSFTERFHNAFVCTLESIVRKFSYIPEQDAILKKHFVNVLETVPTIRQLEQNISVLLLNSYMPMEQPRPTSFNMIPVGGLHIKHPKPLPKHLQQFLDKGSHGAIYFSMGSQVRSADLPAEKLKMFLDVFGSLKQRVLWKFEDDNITNLPANVMIQKWMPQADILAHPNVKVFISHGGLFGTQEAVHFGVPVLGMPVYMDQYLNINKGVAAGYAIGLDYRKISKKQLEDALQQLLYNPSYKSNMERASLVFRDRPLGAMDTAFYWIDYVIKHRGAPHLVSPSIKLSWYQFYLLDVLAVALLIVLLPLIALWFICSKLSRSITPKLKSS